MESAVAGSNELGAGRTLVSDLATTMREKGRTMTNGKLSKDGDRPSTAAASPGARRPYVAPFLRRLDVSESGAPKTPDVIEASFTVGPS